MIVAALGSVLPPLITLSVISFFYTAFASNLYVALVLKGMQAGVAAVILDVVCDLGGKVLQTKSVLFIGLMVVAFAANFLWGVNVVLIIVAAAVIGVVRALFQMRKAVQK